MTSHKDGIPLIFVLVSLSTNISTPATRPNRAEHKTDVFGGARSTGMRETLSLDSREPEIVGGDQREGWKPEAGSLKAA